MHSRTLLYLLLVPGCVLLFVFLFGGSYTTDGMIKDEPTCIGLTFLTGQTHGIDSYNQRFCIGILTDTHN